MYFTIKHLCWLLVIVTLVLVCKCSLTKNIEKFECLGAGGTSLCNATWCYWTGGIGPWWKPGGKCWCCDNCDDSRCVA